MGWPLRDHEENEAIEEDRREKERDQLSRDHITSEKDHDSIPNFPVLCFGAQETQLFFASQAQNPFKGQRSPVARE